MKTLTITEQIETMTQEGGLSTICKKETKNMILNNKQYNISKKKLQALLVVATEIRKNNTLNAIEKQLVYNSKKRAITELKKEIQQFEKLQTCKTNTLILSPTIENIPMLITEYKIKNRLSQKEMAEKLEMKEQQFQRYEADRFKKVSFERLVSFFKKIEVDITFKQKPMYQ